MFNSMFTYEFVLYTTVSAISLYLFIKFFDTFFTKRAPQWLTLLTVLVAEAVMVTFSLLFGGNVIVNAIAGVAVAAGISCLYKMKSYYHVVIALALYTMLSISEYATTSFVTVLFDFDRRFCEYEDYNTIILFFSRFVFYVLLSVIRLAKLKFARSRFHRGLIALVVIPALSISIILMQNRYVAYTDEVSFALSAMALACYAALVVYNILIFDWIGFVKSGVERDTKLAAANELIAVQSQQYLDIMEHNRQVYQIKHDQKNFILEVLSELENENYDSVKNAMLEELELIANSSSPAVSHSIINTIIEHKSSVAKAKGINIETSLFGINSIVISPIDLSIVLGNALDNAIDATEKVDDPSKKTVELLIKAVKGTVLISIKNPTAENVDTDSLASTKQDPHLHGFGIPGIRSIVEKNGGEVIFSCEDKQFKTAIMMKNLEKSAKTSPPVGTEVQV